MTSLADLDWLCDGQVWLYKMQTLARLCWCGVVALTVRVKRISILEQGNNDAVFRVDTVNGKILTTDLKTSLC